MQKKLKEKYYRRNGMCKGPEVGGSWSTFILSKYIRSQSLCTECKKEESRIRSVAPIQIFKN
jgi:hypothetical protein